MLSISVLLDAVIITCLLSSGRSSDTDRQQPYVIVKANSNIPSCMNITEERHHENVPNLTKSDIIKGNDAPGGNSRNFATEESGRNTSCFPLSPQIRHCKTATLPLGKYMIENHTLVYGEDKNLTAMLGDYYIALNGTVLVCSQWLNVTNAKFFPRCHYLKLQPEQYEINENGSWYLKTAKAMVERPTYTVNNQENSVNICFPLSIEFLNCPLKGAFPPSEYNIEHDLKLHLHNNEKKLHLSEHYFHTADTDAVACIFSDNTTYGTSRFIAKVYAVIFFLSSIFLLLTLVIKIRSSKNNLHDKCLICHIASLLISTVLASLRRFIQISPSVCHLFFAIIYLSIMAAYFWLNIIAFDAWQSFASLPGAFTRRRQMSEQCKFRCYLMYAFGVPITILVFILFLDKYRSLQDTLMIFPDIMGQCWLNDTASQLAFYNGPLIALMTINVIFFILTMIHIHKAGKGTDLVNRKRKTQLLIICIKLFVIMGISWMMDGILFSLQDYLPFYNWYISDPINALQGFAIFVVLVVCNKETWKTIRSHISATDIFCKNFDVYQKTRSKVKAPDVKRQISNTTLITQLSMDIHQ